MHETQSWFAGVDWASQKHDVWLADARGKRLGKRTFEHSGEGLATLPLRMISSFNGPSTMESRQAPLRSRPSCN